MNCLSDFYVWEPIAKKTYVKPKELYTGNKEQKRHITGSELVDERPKDFLKGKKGQKTF